MSAIIKKALARKIFNTRGEETLEVDIITESGFGRASAPAGASKGKAEVVYYPKGGVDEAITKFQELVAPELIGKDASNQGLIDNLLHEIDGTSNFSNLGGETAYATSLATVKAASNSFRIPLFWHLAGYLACELPYPLGVVLSGGEHAVGQVPDIQEFLILPVKAASFLDAARANILFHKKIGILLAKTKPDFVGGRNDEGAWLANISATEALQVISTACDEVCEQMGFECRFGIDFAASAIWNHKEKRYVYAREKKKRTTEEQYEYVTTLIDKYNLIYVEDPFHEEDFQSFARLTKEVGNKVLVCGDDLFVTNKNRLQKGVERGAANSLIIKVNQVGTVTDAWETVRIARDARYVRVVSHRSGDTNDTHIAHLAVAFRAPIIKAGIVEGSRIAKINALIRIEETLGDRARMIKLPV
ncbi:MAG: enolase C-terminal domain-like protein [Candidatus Bathyarchaeia archaeon]